MVDVMIHSSEDGMSFKNKNKKWDGWMDGWDVSAWRRKERERAVKQYQL
jgi:hypothetical protein